MVPKAPYSSNPSKAKAKGTVDFGHWFAPEWFYGRISVSLEAGYQPVTSCSPIGFHKIVWFLFNPFHPNARSLISFCKPVFKTPVWKCRTVAWALLYTLQPLCKKPVAEGKVISSGFARQLGPFLGGRDSVVPLCFRTGVRDTDWSFIKILIPTLPASLPSRQPTLLFVDLVLLPLRHRVASKILASKPKASICSPGAWRALPSVCFSRYLSAAARYLSRQGAMERGGQKIGSSTEKVISTPHKGLP